MISSLGNEQAALLRAGRLSDADIAHIAAEIESMGKTEKREPVSRLTILLLDQAADGRGDSGSVSSGTTAGSGRDETG